MTEHTDEKITRQMVQEANIHLFYACGGSILPFSWGMSIEAAEALIIEAGKDSDDALKWMSDVVTFCTSTRGVKNSLLPAMYGKQAEVIWKDRPKAVRARIIDNLAALAG